MNSLDDVISALVPIMTINSNNECGEILYSFESLKQELCHLSNEFIKVGKCFITPNYCYQKKRYELYEYELIITFDNEPFEDFLLKKTGKSDISGVPQEIFDLRRECYIQASQSTSQIAISRINHYIDFLYKNPDVESKIKKVFKRFDPEFLAFTYFSVNTKNEKINLHMVHI